MCDKRETMSSGHNRIAGMVETMLTADSLRPLTDAEAETRRSRKPMARPDALVYELYGLTEVEIRMMEAS
jgi:hypothetical protein